MIAERYATDHHPIVLTQGTSDLFLEAVRRYGEPFADKSALPSLLVCREASRSVKVVLNGDGGDELFAGYQKYQMHPLQQLMGRFAPASARVGAMLDACARDVAGVGPVFRRMRRAVSPLSAVTHFDGFVRSEDQRRLYQPDVFTQVRSARGAYEHALLTELQLPEDLLAKLLHVDYRHYLANDLLVKMDIASMSSSLEARSPLLDHTLFELAARLPASLKLRGRTGKYLLKRLAERYLPREAIYRPKQGFSIPVSRWVRERFRPELEALFASHEPLWTYCRPDAVRQWLNEHLTRRREHGQRLWAMLVLGTWLREEKTRRERAVRHRGVPAEASWSGASG
jgi:asparagine synthase (glutamine-hydrolysing)